LYRPRDGVDAAVGHRLRAVIGNLATRPDLHRNPLRSAKRTPAAWVLRIGLEESSFLPSRDDRSSSAAIVAGQSHRPMPGADMCADCERPMYERVARLSLYSLRRMLVPLRGATRVTGSSSKLPISFSNLKLPTAFAIFLPIENLTTLAEVSTWADEIRPQAWIDRASPATASPGVRMFVRPTTIR
jgi:hypothetical protein